MTTIRSSCPRCGDVDMEPDRVRLVERERMEYTFTCPVCGDFIVKAADTRIVNLLRGAGVQWSDAGKDAPKHPELFDADAPPLTIDDLIELHQELEKW
jgi:rRNA maturation protein Nop10